MDIRNDRWFMDEGFIRCLTSGNGIVVSIRFLVANELQERSNVPCGEFFLSLSGFRMLSLRTGLKSRVGAVSRVIDRKLQPLKALMRCSPIGGSQRDER